MTLAELAEQHELHRQENAEWSRKLEAKRQFCKQLVKEEAARSSALKASFSALRGDIKEYGDMILNGISNSYFEEVAVQVNRSSLHLNSSP